jgi:hypothetical protein
MTLPDNAVIFVDRAEHTGDFKLRLFFNDGTNRIVDFASFLHNSRNPLIRAYLDPARFSQFRIESGDLLWGDYDLCFPIADLYDG